MRLLGKEEQELCLNILRGSGHNNFLGNILYHKLNEVCISITREPPNAILRFTIRDQHLTQVETQTILDRVNEISFFILTTVNLINLLEKEGYILLIRRATQLSQTSEFGGCIKNLPSITNHFTDQVIIDLLIKYFDKEIIATAEFERFCKRGFIARDEQRFKTQFVVSILALCATTIALIANTFFNLLPKLTGGSKINQQQIDTLSSGLKSIETQIDSLNKKVTQYKTSFTKDKAMGKNKTPIQRTLRKK